MGASSIPPSNHRFVVLASASPARLKLLQDAGISPTVIVSHVDEEALIEHRERALGDGISLTPAQVCQVLAQAKAEVVEELLGSAHTTSANQYSTPIVIGCDSVLEWDGRGWGKPATSEEAGIRLREMRGSAGTLHTGHCVIDTATGERRLLARSTVVHFAEMTDPEIDAYVATGEPLKVAGSFTLDGLAAPFVAGIEGDPSNVIGLSLPTLRLMLADLGIAWIQLWSDSHGRNANLN